MNHVVANWAGTPRRETVNGKAVLVVPMTLIVSDSVLHGSRGALFYPREDVAKSASAWNGVPITLGHPTRLGRPVSALNTGVESVGWVENARSNGKLTAEGVIDVAALKKLDPSMLADIEAGRRVELSTGLHTQQSPAPPGASYDYIAREYVPDHVAILTHEQGACSVLDGCGINNTHRPSRRTSMSEFVLNSPTRSCCGSQRGECRCGGDAEDFLPPTPPSVVQNVTRHHESGRFTQHPAAVDNMDLCEWCIDEELCGEPECEDCLEECNMVGNDALPLPDTTRHVVNARRAEQRRREGQQTRGQQRRQVPAQDDDDILPLPTMTY